MLLQRTLFISYLWLNNIPLYTCITTSLCISLSVDIRLLPCLGYCKYSWKEHWRACAFSNCRFSWSIDNKALFVPVVMEGSWLCRRWDHLFRETCFHECWSIYWIKWAPGNAGSWSQRAENRPGPRVSTWSVPSVVLFIYFLTDFCAQLSLGQFCCVIHIKPFLTQQL